MELRGGWVVKKKLMSTEKKAKRKYYKWQPLSYAQESFTTKRTWSGKDASKFFMNLMNYTHQKLLWPTGIRSLHCEVAFVLPVLEYLFDKGAGSFSIKKRLQHRYHKNYLRNAMILFRLGEDISDEYSSSGWEKVGAFTCLKSLIEKLARSVKYVPRFEHSF